MGYIINTKPVLPSGADSQSAPKVDEQSKQPAITITSSAEASQTNSTNQQFGMRDVPESEKHKTMTQEEMQSKLAKGELMYGPVPQVPILDAIEGIKFDYNDGLRVFIPDVPAGQPKKKYHVQILEHTMGVVVHNGLLESGNYITTIQKFYTEFDLYIVAPENTDKDNAYFEQIATNQFPTITEEADKIILKENLKQIYSYARIPDVTKDVVENTFFTNHPDIEGGLKLQYHNAIQGICDYTNETYKFYHRFDPKGKELMVQLPVGTIGDSVGWFAYIERFQKKTGGKIICVMNPVISVLFKKQYPEITFIEPKNTLAYRPYACYKIGLFFKGNTTDQPYDFRYIGNHRTASKILDTNDDDIAPRVDLSAPRQIQEPYVCIAVQASAFCKLWSNPTGWQDVIKHLKSIGYRILCIDKETTTGQGIVINRIPWGVEDFTGNRPLQERINLLKDCDFFIGLSSGVSWLAWCAQCPVVMISGFTNPFNEFYTPYRVINTLFCHGCWNDERCDFDHFDYMWCPRHKGTDKAYECERVISAKHVLNVIEKIPAYQAQKKRFEEKEKQNG